MLRGRIFLHTLHINMHAEHNALTSSQNLQHRLPSRPCRHLLDTTHSWYGCVRAHLCVHLRLRVQKCVCVCARACTCACASACTRVCVCACMWVAFTRMRHSLCLHCMSASAYIACVRVLTLHVCVCLHCMSASAYIACVRVRVLNSARVPTSQSC